MLITEIIGVSQSNLLDDSTILWKQFSYWPFMIMLTVICVSWLVLLYWVNTSNPLVGSVVTTGVYEATGNVFITH